MSSESGASFSLRRVSGREEVSRLFEYELTLLSPAHDLDLDALLGTGMTVEVDGTEGSRQINGRIADVAYRGTMEDRAHYRIVLVPWLWFLGRRENCRIFQHLNAIDIVKQVVSAHGGELDDRSSGNVQAREYCVQYRESDLNFVCRLLEEEGIFFFFEHSKTKHGLVLADDAATCRTSPGYASVPFYSPTDPARRERDHLDSWDVVARVRSARAALRSFDFKQPARPLEAAENAARRHPHDNLEVFDYPGNFVTVDAGDDRARVRLEELRADRCRVFGTGNAVGLACGHRFDLTNFSRSDQNAGHLILAVETAIEVEPQRAVPGAPAGEPYRCKLEAMSTRSPFRPGRATRRPFVQGPQTAIVTGPAGEEIYTDQHGRVKVQFHWDREGKSDANSSCWLRVSQAWAGAGFGAIQLPRIGQEVIVDFLEGDPDHPIITGRVYNAARTPPYGLPGNASQSGMKSNTTKGGGGSNELRFEDKAGGEQVYLHAQKDEVIVVEHDKTETVHNNESITIDVDRTEKVGHNETLTVVNNRTRHVGVNETVNVDANRTVTVGANHTETVGANQTVTVDANRVDTVALNEACTVGIAQQITVGAARNVTVGATQAHEIGINDRWAIGGGRDVAVGGSDTLAVARDRSATIGGDDSLTVAKSQSVQVGKTIAIVAGDEITIKTGSAMIIMKKNGDITIKGKDILIDASGKIDQKAGGNITQKGQKVLQN